MYAWACVYVYAHSLCVYVHACEYLPLFTAAADAVYVGHLFPRLLSLKSIVFFLFVVVVVVGVGVGHQTSSFFSPCCVASVFVSMRGACVCFSSP